MIQVSCAWGKSMTLNPNLNVDTVRSKRKRLWPLCKDSELRAPIWQVILLWDGDLTMLASNSRPQAILLPQSPYQYIQGPLNNVHLSECVYPSIALPNITKYYEYSNWQWTWKQWRWQQLQQWLTCRACYVSHKLIITSSSEQLKRSIITVPSPQMGELRH